MRVLAVLPWQVRNAPPPPPPPAPPPLCPPLLPSPRNPPTLSSTHPSLPLSTLSRRSPFYCCCCLCTEAFHICMCCKNKRHREVVPADETSDKEQNKENFARFDKKFSWKFFGKKRTEREKAGE